MLNILAAAMAVTVVLFIVSVIVIGVIFIIQDKKENDGMEGKE
jgi:preprotein translocase subunit SecG